MGTTSLDELVAQSKIHVQSEISRIVAAVHARLSMDPHRRSHDPQQPLSTLSEAQTTFKFCHYYPKCQTHSRRYPAEAAELRIRFAA